MGKYSEFPSQTPKVTPPPPKKKKKFAIYTPKRDDEYPRINVYMGVPPLGCKDHCVMYIATPTVYRQFASINLIGVVFS